jgi:hypothetical protein
MAPSKFAVSLVSFVLFGSGSVASTFPGTVGDDKPSMAYVAATGEIIIQPDREPIGLFQILSASGIFTANATLPPSPLEIEANTTHEKAWLTFHTSALIEDFSLGVIAPSGLANDFALNDFTINGSGGFGTATLLLDFVYYGPSNTPPRGTDARVHFPAAGPGVTFTHQFGATDTQDPASALDWSGLQFSTDGPVNPKLRPTLSPTGLFSWNTTGSPRGSYLATAIVSDSGGYRDMVVLTINTIPEPATVAMCGLAIIFAGRGCARRRCVIRHEIH